MSGNLTLNLQQINTTAGAIPVQTLKVPSGGLTTVIPITLPFATSIIGGKNYFPVYSVNLAAANSAGYGQSLDVDTSQLQADLYIQVGSSMAQLFRAPACGFSRFNIAATTDQVITFFVSRCNQNIPTGATLGTAQVFVKNYPDGLIMTGTPIRQVFIFNLGANNHSVTFADATNVARWPILRRLRLLYGTTSVVGTQYVSVSLGPQNPVIHLSSYNAASTAVAMGDYWEGEAPLYPSGFNPNQFIINPTIGTTNASINLEATVETDLLPTVV
jgi:hypothetical protein